MSAYKLVMRYLVKGEYLKERLTEAGLSHADMAYKLGVGTSAVSNWASGRSDMPLAQIKKVIELGYLWNPARLSEAGKEWYDLFVGYDVMPQPSHLC
jgi:transcriptional regulator with XRE-family HTH domain